MKFDFNKYKYKRELLIDCVEIVATKDFAPQEAPYFVTFYEMIFLTKGKGVFQLDQEKMPFGAGSVLLLPPNKWRHWLEVDEIPTGYFLIFEEDFIAEFFNDAFFLYRFHFFYNTESPSYINASPDLFHELLGSLAEIQQELQQLRTDSKHFLRSLLYYSLIHINRAYQEQFQIQGQFFEDQLILRFRRLLEKNIRSAHKVSEYAKRLQVSKSHLNRVLKKQFGKSCSEIIKNRLLVEIKRDLLYTDASISEISYDLNFSEPSNFNRFFKYLC